MVSKKKYVFRELLGVVIFPIALALVVVALGRIGVVTGDVSSALNWLAVASVIAGVASFAMSYYVVFKTRWLR